MNAQQELNTQVAVIGNGIAGLAAAMFAANRDLSVAVFGGPGTTDFFSGHIDLLGAFPGQEAQVKTRPWQAIEELDSYFPGHPLNLMDTTHIRASLQEFLHFLSSQGLEYTGLEEENVSTLTPLGTSKPTYRVPETMWQGILAQQEKTPCLFLDIQGMKDFDAAGMVSTLKHSWPDIRSECVSFPGLSEKQEAYPLLLAQRMENKQTRRELAREIAASLRGERAVALSAILGIYSSNSIQQEMEEIIQAKLFEIPTMPSSVPGSRLKETFSKYFDHMDNIYPFLQHRVEYCSVQGENEFLLQTGREQNAQTIRAQAVILASGRYLSQGLIGDRESIREPLLDLPVSQPESREMWHQADLFDPAGHAVNLAGIETDSDFRPVDIDGSVVNKNLYAVGSVLANSDWMRFKCGAGVCISTAYQAVQGICK